MMRRFSELLSAVVSIVLAFSMAFTMIIPAFAAPTTTFSVNVVEDTAEKIVVTVVLEDGGFESINFGIDYNTAKIEKCSAMVPTTAFTAIANPVTCLFSAAIVGGYSVKDAVLATYTFDKIDGAEIAPEDITLVVDVCGSITEQYDVIVENNIPEIEDNTEPSEPSDEPNTEVPTTTFSVNVVEDTTEKIVVTVVLEDGGFESIDFGIDYNTAKIEKCSAMVPTTAFTVTANPVTCLFSAAIVGGYSVKDAVLATYTFDKIDGAEIAPEDITLVVDVCGSITELYDVVIENNIPEIEAPVEPGNPVESIEIVKIPEKTTYILGKDSYTMTYFGYYYDEFGNEVITEYEYEDFSISTDGMEIKVNFKDGTYDITSDIWDYMDSYFEILGQNYGEIWNVGTHIVTVSFYGCETTFEVEIIENPIESIEVYRLPEKTTYILGKDSYTTTYYDCFYDEFENEIVTEYEYEDFSISTDGMEIKVNFKDGTYDITSDIWDYMDSYFEISGQNYGEIWNVGTHIVTVGFYGSETTFEVEIIENPVESIEVYRLPNKTTFMLGVDSYLETYNEYTYDEYGNEVVTEYDYEAFSVSTEGMEIKVNFKDGTYDITSDIWDYMDSYFEISGQDYGEIWNVGTHTVTVSFYGCETTFDVEVMGNPVSSIEFISLSLKDEYLKGEWVDITGAQVKVYFKDGTSKTVTIDYEDYINEYGHWNYETGKVDGAFWNLNILEIEKDFVLYEFSYRGHSVNFTAKHVDKYIKSVSVLSEPTSTNCSGALIEIAYSDNTVATAKILNFDGRFGDNHDGYYYAGGFVRTDVGIFDGFYAYENLFETEKTCFALGLGTYDFVEETPRYTDFNKYFALLRTDELAWSLGGGYNWEFSLDRQIFEGELTNKNIDAMMYTARYLVGYLYDVDYSTKEISGDIARAMLAKIFNVRNIDLTLSNFYNPNEDIYEFAVFDSGWGDGGILETYDIDIYGDCYYITKIVDDLKGEHLYTYYAFFESDGRCSYFNSTPKKFTSLEIETLPNKTEYFVGDTIDLSGLKLKYTNEYDQVIIIETEFDTNITILDSTEIKDISITYKGLDVKIPVNVKSLELIKISVNALPNKLYYKCGDMFDSTGLKLLLTYNSGKTEIIDSGFICIPELLSVAGNQVIAVMYGGLTTTFTVNVSEAGNVVNGKVNSVSVSDTSLAYKATTTITPTISADAGVEYTVTYSSSNPSVASVDENGKVTTGKTGSATITVTVTDEYGNTVTDTCDVSVNYNWWQWIIVIVLFGWIWY